MADRLISERAASIPISAIKEMSILSAAIPDAASLAWGLPSFRTPEPIRAAVEQALRDDPAAGMYSLPMGLPELRKAVARAHARRTGIMPDPDRHVAITAGNMEGIGTFLQVLLDPGDEVILTDPGFVSHIHQIRHAGGTPVFWKMDEAKGWELDIDRLPDLVGPRSKAILLVSPSNPTGAILSEATLRATAEIARRHGLLVIVDDPYSPFVHDADAGFFDLAAVPEYAETVCHFFTFSKVHAMSGWRVGYAVVPEALRDALVKTHDLNMICTTRVAQIAAIAALDESRTHIGAFAAVLKTRRDLICDRLDRLGHVFSYQRPQGAYYVFPRLELEQTDDVAFAHDLLRAAHVTVTPGSAFGPSGAGHVRMAYCVAEEVIDRAFDRMEAHFGT